MSSISNKRTHESPSPSTSMGKAGQAVKDAFSFVPRLVVPSDGVHRIFNPLACRESNPSVIQMMLTDEEDPAPPIEGIIPVENFRNASDGVSPSNTEQQSYAFDEDNITRSKVVQVRERDGAILVEGATDVSALKQHVAQVLSDLPPSLSTRSDAVTSVLAAISSFIGNQTKSTSAAVPLINVTLEEWEEGRWQAVIKEASHDDTEAPLVIDIPPNRPPHAVKHLSWILLTMICVPSFLFVLVFFIPMNSVNDGIEHNRGFNYGISTYYNVMTISPWVYTCKFAFPEANIRVRAILKTLTVTTLASLGFNCAFAEGMGIFPIPFSLLMTTFMCVFMIVPTLWYSCPEPRDRAMFWKMFRILMVYGVSLVVVTIWSIGIRRLEDQRGWQIVLSLFFCPLRFICKTLLAAPVTNTVQSGRWIHLNLVVDILFTRVQVAAFPFIDSYITVILLFGTELFTMLFRYYNGVDRLALCFKAACMAMKSDAELCYTKRKYGHGLSIFYRVLVAANRDVSHCNNALRREKATTIETIFRTLTGDTMAVVQEKGRANAERQRQTQKIHDIESACQQADLMEEGNNTQALHSSASLFSSGDHLAVMDVDPHTHDDDRYYPEITAPPIRTVSSQANDGGSVTHHASSEEDTTPAQLGEEEEEEEEESWEQRPLFHLVDSTGFLTISIISRINQIASLTLGRNLPSANHLNSSFQVSDDKWTRSQKYSWLYIILLVMLLGLMDMGFFRRIKNSTGQQRLTMSGVKAFLFLEDFWFFALWLISTGCVLGASMISHFGADFSFQFEWVHCPDAIEWPSCPEV